MKIIFYFLSLLFCLSCANATEGTYTGSTPAVAVVRSFLGIAMQDSVDFIRWKLTLRDNLYALQCNYGIGKANTNGFVNGGKTVALNGEWVKEKNFCFFKNGTNTLRAVELNEDLLHFLNDNNHLLVGNGGWSYTLNSINPTGSGQSSIIAPPTVFQDSIVFQGRTPCNVPGVSAPGSTCYKIKWMIVFYANDKTKESGLHKISGTPWRKEGGRTGTWKSVAGEGGETIYQLHNDRGGGDLYLLKVDDQILLFTDAQGKLLVGNEDFSYTLNRKW